MATTRISLPIGVSAVYPVNPLTTVLAGPAILGGTVLAEFSRDGRTNFVPWMHGTVGSPMSQLPYDYGYVRFTAATQIGNAFLIDMTGANTPNVTQLANITQTLATPSSTAELVVASVRFPPRFLPPVFTLDIDIIAAIVNSATVKTLRVRWGGLAGTLVAAYPSLASNANFNGRCSVIGRGDGQSIIVSGAGATGGLGLSTTALATATQDYINNETEVCVTIQKATAGDLATLEAVLMKLY